MKTVSVAELSHGGASRAVRDAQHEPVLVSKDNHPAAWILSASELARLVKARGAEFDVYQRALELLAIDLYQREVLTLGRAAKLAGMSLGDFIDLCDKLGISVLWDSPEGLAADVATFADALETRT
jgi:predicted HTH domain antitoxin